MIYTEEVCAQLAEKDAPADEGMSADLQKFAWLHIYAQFMWHSPALIVGTKEGLLALRSAVDRAIAGGEAEASVIANDGEGYGLTIRRASQIRALGRPQYIMQERDDEVARRLHEEMKYSARHLPKGTSRSPAGATLPADSETK